MKLHTYGLLRDSFRLAQHMKGVRTVWRVRGRHVEEAACSVPHMQKALTKITWVDRRAELFEQQRLRACPTSYGKSERLRAGSPPHKGNTWRSVHSAGPSRAFSLAAVSMLKEKKDEE